MFDRVYRQRLEADLAQWEADGRPSYCGDTLQITYGLERYFVPEGEGRTLEQMRDQRKLTVVAAVLPSGRAAIKRLLVDGEPFYDEPWF